jgi:hypothetical protein
MNLYLQETDAVGNVSDISKNIARIIVDNTNPIFDSQPTTIDTHINTPITATVYGAQVTNLNGGNARAIFLLISETLPTASVCLT